MDGSTVVVFDPATWKLRYPEFAQVPDSLAQLYFNEATIYCRNNASNPICVQERTPLLNMLTAHIAALSWNKPSNQPVGRLSDVTEGSVSASFQNDYPPGTAQWYQQTPYGSSYWTATAPWRTARYRPPQQATRGPFPWVYPNQNS